MLTYQLQKRVYMVDEGKKLVFPNDVEIQILLEPPEPFGAGCGPSRTVAKGCEVRLMWNANVGRSTAQPKRPLQPLNVSFESKNVRFTLEGNKFIARTRCKSRHDLDVLLTNLHYGLPMVLNIEFLDSPFVKQSTGKVGDIPFAWLFAEHKFSFDVTTKERQEGRIVSALERLFSVGEMSNQRLIAAMHYLYVACRLVLAGSSYWEFMAEVILNLCKVLQVLFGESRDAVRSGLAELGYSEDEIEGDFMPIMILRSKFDVGHVTLSPSPFTLEELQTLYRYLEDSEGKVRELLRRILDKIREGSYTLLQDRGFVSPKRTKREIGQLICVLEKRGSKRGKGIR